VYTCACACLYVMAGNTGFRPLDRFQCSAETELKVFVASGVAVCCSVPTSGAEVCCGFRSASLAQVLSLVALEIN